jgi:hypothetical protein
LIGAVAAQLETQAGAVPLFINIQRYPTIGYATAFGRRPLSRASRAVHRADLKGQLRVDLTYSARPRAMTGICVKRPAGIDVKRTFRIALSTSQLGG